MKESTVPDVLVDPPQSPTKRHGQRNLIKIKSLPPGHGRLSLEKSVTWQDDEHLELRHTDKDEVHRKIKKQVDSKQTALHLHTSQMDELVRVLSDLCESLEQSSMIMSSLKREAAPYGVSTNAVLLTGKSAGPRRRSVDFGREIKRLAIRKEKVTKSVALLSYFKSVVKFAEGFAASD